MVFTLIKRELRAGRPSAIHLYRQGYWGLLGRWQEVQSCYWFSSNRRAQLGEIKS